MKEGIVESEGERKKEEGGGGERPLFCFSKTSVFLGMRI